MKRFISLSLCCIGLMFLLSGCVLDRSKTKEEFAIGKIVTFGVYEQDGNTNNGKEPIEWIVLAENGSKRLLLSRYVIDALPYNETEYGITWETCTLRFWLNNDFFQLAFSEEEKAKVYLSTIENPDNPMPDANSRGGNTTEDKVFLLSISEAEKYMNLAENRIAIPTDYSKLKEPVFEYRADGCEWWLRSPGVRQTSAAMVRGNGHMVVAGKVVNSGWIGSLRGSTLVGIRPAIWINIY